MHGASPSAPAETVAPSSSALSLDVLQPESTPEALPELAPEQAQKLSKSERRERAWHDYNHEAVGQKIIESIAGHPTRFKILADVSGGHAC